MHVMGGILATKLLGLPNKEREFVCIFIFLL
jgi:hypothetical protein